jgi:hypothetical protein
LGNHQHVTCQSSLIHAILGIGVPAAAGGRDRDFHARMDQPKEAMATRVSVVAGHHDLLLKQPTRQSGPNLKRIERTTLCFM